jgi:hypothetical protein
VSTFDPERHDIIAKDRLTGEHIHLSVPDLVREVQEVRETRVELPESAIVALQAMAAKMQAMEREAAELKQRLEQVEAPLRALAEEAKRRMEAA